MTAPVYAEIDVDLIVPHPGNVRRDVGDVSDLAANIKALGLLHPLLVAPAPATAPTDSDTPGSYVVIAGHRRLAALRSIGSATVPCTINPDLVDPIDQVAVMLSENGERSDLTPAEEAAGVQEMLDMGESVAAIARRTGWTKTKVRQRAKISDLDEKVLAKLHTSDVTIADAVFIAENPDHAPELEKAIGTQNWGVARERVKATLARDARVNDQRAEAEALGIKPLPDSSIYITRQALSESMGGITVDIESQGPWDPAVLVDLDPAASVAHTVYLGYEQNLNLVVFGWDPDEKASATSPEQVAARAAAEAVAEREQAEAEEAAAQWRAVQAAAAAVRADFLRDLPAEKKAAAAGKAMTLCQHSYQSNWWTIDPFDVLPLDDGLDAAAAYTELDRWLHTATPTDIAWAFAMTRINERCEARLHNAAVRGTYRGRVLAADILDYFDFLDGLGYVRSDAEQQVHDYATAELDDSGEQ